MQFRKQYVPWPDFEMRMIQAGLTDVSFLNLAGLGLYTLRDWKRTNQAPKWAMVICDLMLGQGPTPREIEKEVVITQVEVDPEKAEKARIVKEMTELELKLYYTGSKAQMETVYAAAKKRLDEIVPYDGVPAFTPDKPLEF